MANTVELTYTADVVVTVDLDTGSVERVQVDDEGAKAPDPADDRERAALAIAGRTDWPAWEFGF
jgi:hypothetical protein